MEKTLELVELRKAYTPKVVPVKNINLKVSPGEFLTLLGPSGCGKSTILRLIAGLEQPTSGQVMISGRDVSRLSPGDRNIAMVFQSYALYPHMSVYDNIASSLKLRKTPTAEIKHRIQEVADFLGLHELMDRKPGQLSGGQRQRVAVARTLVRRPAVFLLDEPLSNLDALLREHVRAELKQLFSSQNAPIVYVTHDQTEAMTLSTKVAVLNNGYLQQLDSPDLIYREPANQFVAGFIGSPQMNFLRVPCDEAGLNGEVFLIENLGMHYLASVRVSNPTGLPMTVRALVGLETQLRQGTHVRLVFPPDAIHWFEPSTGDRLTNNPIQVPSGR
jgi:multiple sugar transport system ATP-binding protein